MLKGETILDVQNKFTHIMNHLISVDKIFERKKQILATKGHWNFWIQGFDNIDHNLLVW